MTASTLQYRRECTVILGDSSAGSGLSITGDLRIKFEITKTIGRTPNTALVQIYNLAPDPEGRAQIEGEFSEIIINAGYKDNSRLVFAGSIRHTFRYRDGNDYIFEIDAADGDSDLRNTIVNTTFAAGTTASQELDHVIAKFKKTTKGHVAGVNLEKGRIRGKVVSGAASKIFDRIATENDAHWSVQDGVLIMVPVSSTLPTEAIVLRSDTGLLGAPELDDKGIKATCLLNPQIKVGGKVQIDNADVKAKIAREREKKPGAKHPSKARKKELARFDPDGVYKVIKVVHKGDSRGTGGDWTSEILCVGLSKAIPAGQAAA